ncbi:MAG: hypothetical protein ACYDHP_09515 [Ferrimicrobium sp.]
MTDEIASLAQIVRSRFDEIARWRSQSVPWSEIATRLDPGHLVSPKILNGVHRAEVRRRTHPTRLAAARWALTNSDEIASLRERGVDWYTIIDILPPTPAPPPLSADSTPPTVKGLTPKVEMLTAEFEALTRSVPQPYDHQRAATRQAHPIPSLRDQALQQLTDLYQHQVVEALADVQCLPDDHPIWATVALLGAVIAKAGSMNVDTAKALADVARLDEQMPSFLSRLEEVLCSTQRTLASIETRLARLEARAER